MMNYKNYQQVVCLNTKQPKVVKKHRSVRKPASTTGKKRTKTGCLTCRKRKKKCDEETIDGKCQACTRNFLPCCWPTPNIVEMSSAPQNTEIVKTPISSPTTSPMSAYPSPRSPTDLHSDDDIKSLSLDNSNYKLVSFKLEGSDVPKSKHTIKNAEEVQQKNKSSELKFIITSVDSHQELCHVSSD